VKFVQKPVEMKIMQPVLIPIDVSILLPPQKYALLITGDVAESGYNEFWNDTVWMYKTLRNAGYSAENIYVLYGAGSDYPTANPNYKMPGESKITDFPATLQWVNKVLDGMKNGDAALGIRKMRPSDTLFVWTFDHGGGGPTNSYLCLMYGGWISDSQFAAKLNALPYASRTIYMQQCRSGGFIDDLKNSKTFISTACRGGENAHRADTENENVCGIWYCHGEYNYYVISALAGKTATGGACNADSNGSGKVSSLEAHNWMSSHENQPEIPQMDNMGGVGGSFFIK